MGSYLEGKRNPRGISSYGGGRPLAAHGPARRKFGLTRRRCSCVRWFREGWPSLLAARPAGMGLYRRPDSPFWWLCLERPGQRPIRESTRIPVDGGTPGQTRQNRELAEQVYAARMGDLARGRYRLPTDRPSAQGGATFHCLRHTGASRMLNRGVDIRTVAELGNWRAWRVLRRYLQPVGDAERGAVELWVHVSFTCSSRRLRVKKNRPEFEMELAVRQRFKGPQPHREKSAELRISPVRTA